MCVCVHASNWRQTACLPQRDLFWLDSTTLSPSDLWHLISLRPHLLCSLGNNIPQINNKPAPQALSRLVCTHPSTQTAPLRYKQKVHVLFFFFSMSTVLGFRWKCGEVQPLCQFYGRKNFQVLCAVKFLHRTGFITRIFTMQIWENSVCVPSSLQAGILLPGCRAKVVCNVYTALWHRATLLCLQSDWFMTMWKRKSGGNVEWT